jgi:hypothetical protein
MEAFDVFLSHHSGDKPWVIALKSALTARGVSVWLDRDEIRPGDRFVDALEQGLESSRAVAIIVSPASLRSRWAKDEYQRALVLSNSQSRELRIVPCLLRGADLPGFLATRHAVDFRDPAKFETAVDELCFGITGRRPDGTAHAPTLTGGEVTPLEVEFLDRTMAALRKERTPLLAIRASAPVLGLAAGALSPAVAGIPGIVPYLASAAVTGLLGIGLTARSWSAVTVELKQMAAHREALELCSRDFRPVCTDVVEAFNRLLKRRIGLA